MTQTCGCCATPAAALATHPANRPWLSAIDYRLGTFATFREAILDELAGTPALAGLRSRVSDDYGVATVEMWSAVADVLTFYTERIANEAFLRTATPATPCSGSCGSSTTSSLPGPPRRRPWPSLSSVARRH